MKLPWAVPILLVASNADALGFVSSNSRNIGRRNVEHTLEVRGATTSYNLATGALTTPSVATQLNSSQVLSYTISSPSIPLSGKGPETGMGTSEVYTETLSPVSILTTAKGPETPQSRSFLATSTALGVFTSLSPPSTVTASPRITEIISVSLMSTTVDGSTRVDVSIISQASSRADPALSVLSTSVPLDGVSHPSSLADTASLVLSTSAPVDNISPPGVGVVTIISKPSSQADTASSALSMSAPVATIAPSGIGIVTILSSPDEHSATFFPDVPSTSPIANSLSSPQPVTIISTDNVVVTSVSTSATNAGDSPHGFVTVFISAAPSATTNMAISTLESEVQQTSAFASPAPVTVIETQSEIVSVITASTISVQSTVYPFSNTRATVESEVQQTSSITSPALVTVMQTDSEVVSATTTSTMVDQGIIYPLSSTIAPIESEVQQTSAFASPAPTTFVETDSEIVSATITNTGTPSISPTIGIIVPMPTLNIVRLSGEYTYIGCFTEGTGQRALQNATFPSDSNAIGLCTAACYPYKYAGVEYGRECWCGDSLEGGSSQVPDSECAMPCAGDAGEVCGDSVRLTLYEWAGNSSITSGQISSTQAAPSTTAAALSQVVSSTESETSTMTITVSPLQSSSVSTAEPTSTQNPASISPSTTQILQPSVSLETTTQFMKGNGITISFTVPAQTPTSTHSLITMYNGCSASIMTAFAAAGPGSLLTPSNCNCPAQVTLTVTEFQTIAVSVNETATWYPLSPSDSSSRTGTYSAPPPLTSTSTITGRNTIKGTTENASPTTSSALTAPTTYDGPMGGAGRSEGSLKLVVLVGGVAVVLLV
ncbi:uncharacterized protein PAC_16833 [Phialocephala subalpina]|uniref:WSC domain-containing protein n=1 Tax=Phialocephala subalpina TaxID=576137 RepID=A0A1L7XPI8_9HELO|nr:uncharacterized protein PAC_16833 [Phialocephala subalpina]